MDQSPPGPTPTLANYQLRLPAYEGPLDVLLRMIERSRLAIEDVSLVAVTDQFLAFVATLDQARPAVVADFAAVGARLTVLKSRSLLPRPVADDEEPEQSDLTHQLREYKRIKDLARHLGQLHAAGLVAHGPGRSSVVSPPVPGHAAPLRAHDVQALVRSLKRRLTVVPRPATFVRQRRVVSLREVIERVSHLLRRERSLRFSEVVAPLVSRTDVATAFLAVLVLVRREAVVAEQGDLFSEIHLGQGTAGTSLDTPIDEFVN